MAPSLDIEAQSNSESQIVPDPLPPPPTNIGNPQLPTAAVPQPQATNANEYHNGNAPAQQAADNSRVHRDENHGDSSDGLWSMYLTVAEKQDAEVTESWKGDTDGILVFTGLFSTTVASFIIESYHNLSPDSSDTTNALLTQISQQLVNISNGTPLTSVGVQSGQPFKPTASAVRVNVLWFLSLVLSLTCALSATLMQQWARRYRELAQRRGVFHRRGRMRAYISEGINRFGMTRAVATMPTLLHTSVFLFFAGLFDFLFPIYAPVAYSTLSWIIVFALAYAILTVLPTIYLNCPYDTPLSGITWRIFQLSVFVFLWTILKIEGLSLKLRSLANQHVAEPHRLKTWRETTEEQVKIRQRWFSQSLRKSVQLSAYEAKSTVVTSALEWTLTALDDDKEIEDFAAQVPGFFDSRVVPDATLAVLSLMSHQPTADPILGSRLYDLLKTSIPGTSVLDETMRKHRLYVCLKCLWYFGRAYNQPGVSQPLPSYFLKTLFPEISRRVQIEEDSALRVIGRCAVAVIMNKLAVDLESRAIAINSEERECLSAILGTESRDVKLLLSRPGAVALANTISLFDNVGSLVTDTTTSGVLDVVQQTLGILSRSFSSVQKPEVQPIAIIIGSDGIFERTLVSRLLDLFNACIQVHSPPTDEVRRSCMLVYLKGLWYFGRAFNQLGNSVPLPSYICIAVTNLKMSHLTYDNPTTSVMAHCVGALVVNKLVSDFKSRNVPVSDEELACLSAVLGTKRDDVMLLLNHPGAVELTSMVFIALGDSYSYFNGDPSHASVLDIVQQTFYILSHRQVLPPDLNSKMRLNQTCTLMNVPDGTSSLAAEMYRSILRVWMKNLWHFAREYNEPGNVMSLPSYVWIAFANPEMTRRIRKQRDPVILTIGCCIVALVVNKLVSDLKSRNVLLSDNELACLSAILGTRRDDVMLLLSHPGAVELTNMVFFALDVLSFRSFGTVPSYVLDVVQQTYSTLSQSLPSELNVEMGLNQTDTPMNVSDEISSLTAEMCRGVLRVWMKNLWHFAREYNGSENMVSLPSYVWIAFTNPEMTRCIRERHGDPVTHAIGRCVEALVVNKLAADINSRNIPVSDDELACLSAILGTKKDDAVLLLSHPGAVELTNMVFLSLDVLSFRSFGTVPSYVLDVVQQTSSTLSQSLPPELNVEMGRDVLRVWMNLWHFAREYTDPGNVVSSPSYVWIAFANPEMTRRIHDSEQRDIDAHVIGRCVEALVVNNLIADINSHSAPVGDAELACLSTIFGTASHDVRLCLSQPGTVELLNLTSLVLGGDNSRLSHIPLDTRSVFQLTLATLSQALPAQANSELPRDQMVALSNVSDDNFEHTIVSRLHGLLEMCTLGASSLKEEVRTSCLRMCLKSLWHWGTAYHRTSDPLPSYFPLVLARPEITRHLQTEQDHVTRITGCCFNALVVCKLGDALESPISFTGQSNTELECISAILGTEHPEALLSPYQLRDINFRNVVSIMSGEFDASTTAAGMPADLLNIARDTLDILGYRLCNSMSSVRGLPVGQRRSLQEIYSDIVSALGSDQLKNETVKTLDRLRQILEKLLPGVE